MLNLVSRRSAPQVAELCSEEGNGHSDLSEVLLIRDAPRSLKLTAISPICRSKEDESLRHAVGASGTCS